MPAKSNAQAIRISELTESPFNPRHQFGDLAELTDSIKRHGVVEPLLARKVGDGFELIIGHRRLRAAKKAGLKEVPVMIEQLTDSEAQELQLVENVQREDLHPMEEAEAYGRLHAEHGYSIDEVAERTGKTKATVYARVKLLDLLPEGRRAFAEGHLTPSSALLVARLKGERMQHAALSILTVKNRYGDLMPAREAAAAVKRLQAEEEATVKRAAVASSGEKALRNTIRRIRSYAMGRVVEQIEKRQDLQPNDLRMVLSALTADGAPEGLLERRGLESEKQLQAKAQKMGASELRGLLVETALTSWLDEGADDANARLKAACKAFSLDYRDIERTVRELQIKDEQKAAADNLFRK